MKTIHHLSTAELRRIAEGKDADSGILPADAAGEIEVLRQDHKSIVENEAGLYRGRNPMGKQLKHPMRNEILKDWTGALWA